MKTDSTKRYLNDKDRDSILKLLVCGLSCSEIAETLCISKSTVSYIRQAHTACINKDWSTLQRLSTVCKPCVEWAMRVTGTDKVFKETFPKDQEPEVEASKPEPVPTTIAKEDFESLRNTLQDICYLLTEIRDILK